MMGSSNWSFKNQFFWIALYGSIFHFYESPITSSEWKRLRAISKYDISKRAMSARIENIPDLMTYYRRITGEKRVENE